jgi:hypothetical protein
MKIITVDGNEFDVKYRQNRESITNEFGTSVHNYPNFVGSKLHQNSSSSDIYEINFAIHKSKFVGFKESIKKFVTNEEDAINYVDYGKLMNIVIVHDTWGVIKGNFIGSIKYQTSSDADIECSGTFQEHTEDDPEEKKDLEQENSDADEGADEPYEKDLTETDKGALAKFADNMQKLYKNIKNSAVVEAFNDLNSAINDVMLNSQKIMNATKKILSLPNKVLNNTRGRIDLFKKQARAIKNIPVSSMNMAVFNVKCLSYNLNKAARIPFIDKEALRQKAGLKSAPLK